MTTPEDQASREMWISFQHRIKTSLWMAQYQCTLVPVLQSSCTWILRWTVSLQWATVDSILNERQTDNQIPVISKHKCLLGCLNVKGNIGLPYAELHHAFCSSAILDLYLLSNLTTTIVSMNFQIIPRVGGGRKRRERSEQQSFYKDLSHQTKIHLQMYIKYIGKIILFCFL